MTSAANEPELSNYKRLIVNNGRVSISLTSCSRIANGVTMEALDGVLRDVTDSQWISFINVAAR